MEDRPESLLLPASIIALNGWLSIAWDPLDILYCQGFGGAFADAAACGRSGGICETSVLSLCVTADTLCYSGHALTAVPPG